MKRRGFTIVELVITITVMVILLTLAVVNISSTQANARDAERKADVESIAMYMENYYSSNIEDGSSTGFFSSGGTYPGSSYMGDYFRTLIPDADPKVLRAPGVSTDSPASLIEATNNVQTVTGITPKPSATNDVYVYQPIQPDGALCVDPAFAMPDCVKFNIYYYQEKTGKIEMITSRHQ